MKRYKVIYTETRTLVDYIEAESEEEAYDKFHNENDYQSSDWIYSNEETKIEEKSMADVLSAFFENVEQEGE